MKGENKKNKMQRYEEIQKEEIYFKVLGENKINEVLNYSIPLFLDLFKDLKGEQILKSGYSVNYGELLKKHKDKTDLILKDVESKFNNEEINYNLYLDCSEYSIYLKVKLRFNNLKENGFIYYEGYKYILGLKNGNLERFFEFEEEKPINPDEQYKTFFNCLKLLKELDEEKAKLKPYSLKEMVK